MKYPETAALAKAAFERSGCNTHREFADLICAGRRSFARWITGEGEARDISAMVLRNVAAGWMPEA